ncbi:hypothetical protein AAVH_40646 [Aphelenchoides avenae]|nr:hypothetical protein AAVH_40646 [Aphelenchus avenae]
MLLHHRISLTITAFAIGTSIACIRKMPVLVAELVVVLVVGPVHTAEVEVQHTRTLEVV